MKIQSRLSQYGSADLGRLQAGAAAGALAGVGAGAVSRLSMRGVALAAGLPPDFSVGGTLAILLIGAIFGVLFGWLFQAVRALLVVPARWRGLAFGLLLLGLLVVLPFTLADEGELALLPPLVNIALFAPVPVAFGLLVQLALARLEANERVHTGLRLGIPWLMAFVVALGAAVASLTTLGQFSLPSPSAMVFLYPQLGLTMRAAHELRNWVVALFGVVYFGAALVILWRGSQNWVGKFAVLALLVFAAGFFSARDVFAGLLTLRHNAPTPGTTLQALGMALMLALLYVFPDGRFQPRWTRPLAVLWLVWLLLWVLPVFPRTILDPGTWPRPALMGVLWLALGTGVLAQGARYRALPDSPARWQSRRVALGAAVCLGLVGLLWVTLALNPRLQVQTFTSVQAAPFFAFGPYLLPWLLLPLALASAIVGPGQEPSSAHSMAVQARTAHQT